MYAVFEQLNPTTPKRRVMVDLAFASLEAAVAHFAALGGFAEIDEDNNAADVFTKGGIILTVEAA
jgi:hypothetical protein